MDLTQGPMINQFTNNFRTKLTRRLWTQFFGESYRINHSGDVGTGERQGLIARSNHLSRMLRAADVVKYCGKQSVTVIECIVASRLGLLNIIDMALMTKRETGIELRIFGFDTGQGLPVVQGYKDHPELWGIGDVGTEDRHSLTCVVRGRTETIWGDIANTIRRFTHSIESSFPLGFLSVDLDIYSATKAALHCPTGPPENYRARSHFGIQ